MTAQAKPQPHVPREDSDVPPDFAGMRWCVCSRRWDSPVHVMPEVPREVVEAEARRVGEVRR